MSRGALLAVLAVLCGSYPSRAATEVRLAAGGKALLRVVVSERATDSTRSASRILADYLGQITGARFSVEIGDGRQGLAVGLVGDFPALAITPPWKPGDPTDAEDYLLRSHRQGIYLFGASEHAVEHAVWDLLYRLGYRQFFPGKTWEVIPYSPSASLAVDVHEHPSFYARRIWYGFGASDYAREPYATWCARNRAVSGIELRTGHSYDGILSRNRAEFARHPEYLGLVNGVRKTSKFCISNPSLRKLIVEDALAQFARDPSLQSISLDPSDGGGWCECDNCRAMGSVSDRALTLANEVAAAVRAKHGDRFVGMYAYSEHSPPPSIRVDRGVVISVATSFIRGGYTVDQLMAGWRNQGATLGVREYFSVNTWDRDLPGAARGSRPDYVAESIPRFHKNGARFFSAESSDNWGPNGLGYYLASRILWDVSEAKRVPQLKADFFARAFGPAREPARRFYEMIDGADRPLLSDDLIARMYRTLSEARRLADELAIQARIDHLILYTHYLERWLDYSTASGKPRQEAFERLIRFAYRIGPTMMIHTRGLARDLPNRDKLISLPAEAGVNVPAARNPWKDETPFTRAETDELLARGLATRKPFDFRPVTFGEKLVPPARLQLPAVQAGSAGLYLRGTRTFWTWADSPSTLALKARAGVIYANRGPAQFELYPVEEPEGKPVATVEVAPDKQDRPVRLATTYAGLHRIQVSDHSAGTAVSWEVGLPMTVRSSPADPATFHGRWSLYFYVPKGTKVVGGFASGQGTMRDGDGRTAYTFENRPHYFSVAVPSGQDGRLWKFHQCTGQRLLMTVPPYLARSERELLLPAEVVEADAPKQ